MANMKRNAAGEEEKTLKFKCFGPPKPKPAKIPKASQLLKLGPPMEPPPKEVTDKCKNCDLIVAIDIETNILVQENTNLWTVGQFGFPARVGASSLSQLRAVQLGWAVAERNSESPSVFSRVIKPDGFSIHPDATKVHGITHDEPSASEAH